MGNWNLPDGCNDNMIPGNRPQDIAREMWEDNNLPTIIDNFIDQNQDAILGLVREFFLDGVYGILGMKLAVKFEDFLDESYKEQGE